MTTMTIYYGKAHPIKAIGKHQCKLLDFAHTYKGWHTFNTKDRDTVRAVKGLHNRGYLEVVGINSDLSILDCLISDTSLLLQAL